MKNREHITAFYMETLLLIAVFMVILMLITRVFGIAARTGSDAKLLTNAVCLAQNAAEAVAGSGNSEELLSLLNENGNAVPEDGGVAASYRADMTPEAGGPFLIRVSWEPEGSVVSSRIEVRYQGRKEPVYTLTTAVCAKGKEDVS